MPGNWRLSQMHAHYVCLSSLDLCMHQFRAWLVTPVSALQLVMLPCSLKAVACEEPCASVSIGGGHVEQVCATHA